MTATRRQSNLMQLASLELRLTRSENLPVLPQAVSEVMRLADDPNVSPREIERVIERDPSITAKILKVANSAYYGGTKVPTIGRAIAFLGMNAVRSLVVSIAFQQMISGKSTAQSFCKLEYWRHSLGVASAARILGKIKMPIKAEELYCAGMMHDIGMMVMDKFMPAELDAAITASVASGRSLHDVQIDQLGWSYANVGGMLADKWKLNGLIRNAILYHTQPIEDGDYYETTSVISIANAIAHQAGFTNNTPGIEVEFDGFAADAIGLPVEQFAVIRDLVVAEVTRAQDAFHIK